VLTAVLRYSEALAYVLFALALRWVADPYLSMGLPFLTFFIAIAVTAWRVGVGPALAATVFSGFLAGYSFFPQPGLLALESGQLLAVGIFIGEGAVLTLLISGLKHAKEEVQQVNARLEDQMVERTKHLKESYERVRSLTTELALTEQRGRRQLALELHDYLAQLLVVTRMKLSKMSHSVRDPRVKEEVSVIDEALQEVLTYCRTLMTELNPPGLETGNLQTALHGLADRMGREGLKVPIHIMQQPTLTPNQAILLYQAIRELLFNVLKHAKVDTATISVSTDAQGRVCVAVEDQGIGFTPTTGWQPGTTHFGLDSVQERMRTLGGDCVVQSEPGRGTRVELVLPKT
jgi:signal transduction histidine kinase